MARRDEDNQPTQPNGPRVPGEQTGDERNNQ